MPLISSHVYPIFFLFCGQLYFIDGGRGVGSLGSVSEHCLCDWDSSTEIPLPASLLHPAGLFGGCPSDPPLGRK